MRIDLEDFLFLEESWELIVILSEFLFHVASPTYSEGPQSFG